eukprot:762982-Hanusia_phi.AAC.5
MPIRQRHRDDAAAAAGHSVGAARPRPRRIGLGRRAARGPAAVFNYLYYQVRGSGLKVYARSGTRPGNDPSGRAGPPPRRRGPEACHAVTVTRPGIPAPADWPPVTRP